MAKGKRYGKAKKGFKKRYNKPKTTTNINKSLTPFAQRYITKMKYSENVISALSQYRFRLNGLFDPNLTGGGHQPHGFDQLATIYNRYRVIGCSYTVYAIPQTGSNTIRVACLPANESVVPTGVADAVESPRCKWKFIDNTSKGAAQRIRYFLEYGLPENWKEQMTGKAPLSYLETNENQ